MMQTFSIAVVPSFGSESKRVGVRRRRLDGLRRHISIADTRNGTLDGCLRRRLTPSIRKLLPSLLRWPCVPPPVPRAPPARVWGEVGKGIRGPAVPPCTDGRTYHAPARGGHWTPTGASRPRRPSPSHPERSEGSAWGGRGGGPEQGQMLHLPRKDQHRRGFIPFRAKPRNPSPNVRRKGVASVTVAADCPRR